MADAKFAGFQQTEEGTSIPLFNITKLGHPKEGSTVTLKTLKQEGLIPPPIFQEDRKVSIGATIPAKLAMLIKNKAEEENILFQDKAGYYLLLGIEAERGQNH